MGHDHNGCCHEHHEHTVEAYRKTVIIGGITLLLQVILVFVSGSLALRGDTIHLTADCTFLFANLLIVQQAFKMSTRGGARLRNLAAIIGIALLAFGAWNIYSSAQERIAQHITIGAEWMLAGGVLGLVANILMYRALHAPRPGSFVIIDHHSGDLLRAPPFPDKHVQDSVVEAHILADLFGSAVVIFSASASLVFEFHDMDSYSGIVLAIFMVYLCISSTWKMVRGEPIH